MPGEPVQPGRRDLGFGSFGCFRLLEAAGETALVFGAKIAGDTGGRSYLRTGDSGYLRGDELYVTGRLKDLIILNGVHPPPARH